MTNTDKPEKKQTGVRLNADLLKRLKYLSVDLERPLTDLFEEAVEDLLTKHQRQK
jgi:predicted DNA-binding protein